MIPLWRSLVYVSGDRSYLVAKSANGDADAVIVDAWNANDGVGVFQLNGLEHFSI